MKKTTVQQKFCDKAEERSHLDVLNVLYSYIIKNQLALSLLPNSFNTQKINAYVTLQCSPK
jgi:hypothetical protein